MLLSLENMALNFLRPTAIQWAIDHPEYSTPAYPAPILEALLTLAYNLYPQMSRLSPEIQITAFELAVCHQRQLADRLSCGIDGVLIQLKSRNDSRTFRESNFEDQELSSTSCGRSLYALLQTAAGGLHVNVNKMGCCPCKH